MMWTPQVPKIRGPWHSEVKYTLHRDIVHPLTVPLPRESAFVTCCVPLFSHLTSLWFHSDELHEKHNGKMRPTNRNDTWETKKGKNERKHGWNMDKRMWTDGFARRRDAQKKDRQTSRSLDKQMTNKWKQRGGQQWLTNSFNMIQQNPDRNIYIYINGMKQNNQAVYYSGAQQTKQH